MYAHDLNLLSPTAEPWSMFIQTNEGIMEVYFYI